MSRVRWLNITFILGLAALCMVFAVACGSSDTAEPAATAAAAPTAAPAATTAPAPTNPPTPDVPTPEAAASAVGSFPDTPFPLLMAPEDNPKRGGRLRRGFGIEVAHFDFQQGSVVNLFLAAPTIDNLIRQNPLSETRELVPDLATSWDIAEDGLAMTFYLREGVKFTDGALMTSEDVKATLERMIFPPSGVISPRASWWQAAAISELKVVDPLTVQFVMTEPRTPSLLLNNLSSGWNGILRKQTLEENNFDLKRIQDFPTTGPYRMVDYSDHEFVTHERNDDYWNPELPYLDGMDSFHLNYWTPEMAAGLLTDLIDYGFAIEPAGFERILDQPDRFDTALVPLHVQFAVWFNTQKAPLDDARVRRAIHLVIDRYAIKETNSSVHPAQFGAGFLHAQFGGFSLPLEELQQRPGYRQPKQQDIDIALGLLADAGYPNGEGMRDLDFLVRQAPHHVLHGSSVEQQVRTALGIKLNIIPTDIGVWFEDVQKGDFDLTTGASEFASVDPSSYWRGLYGTDGAQNYGLWSNAEFDAALNAMDRETDEQQRIQLMRDAEQILETEVPQFTLAYENLTHAWRSYVKGHTIFWDIGFWDNLRLDTVWLDQ